MWHVKLILPPGLSKILNTIFYMGVEKKKRENTMFQEI